MLSENASRVDGARALPTLAETRSPVALAGALPIVVLGLTIAAVYRRGAIHDPDSAMVGAVSTAAIALSVARGVDRQALRVLVCLAAFDVWWMASADLHGTPIRFLPLGASVLGFAAAFLVTRTLAGTERRAAAGTLVAVGAVSAAIGLVAEAWRIFPFAARAQDIWRLSTTLTYANAGGLLCVMAILVGLGLGNESRLVRVALCLCTTGLVATESRGAALAFAGGLLLVPWRQVLAASKPLGLGVLGGSVAVATSTGDGIRPLLIGAVVIVTVVSALPLGDRQGRANWRWVPVAVGACVLAVLLLGVTSRTTVHRRLVNDRTPEWDAAVAQWRSAPLLGVGSDKPLMLSTATRTVAPFAQSEYLQVLAGTGLLGELLLVGAGVAVVSVLSRRDVLARGAGSAVGAFAVAGAFDFLWHVPALALVAGAAAGIAAKPRLQSSPLPVEDRRSVGQT